ncbi:hypothetical protein M406DRAFT_69373 [Cryphonectria parasitica EP155]|uniref:Uncharacterized protein n=1 Tax=Cryphonectria parasitica (strain ATCC 38755 / EP155) TaxID=660469 RepID=A0A9P5CRK9_CRYP1|nr:uncharacterized protein M406DRAFT_69373 [Cryphonectria parasitica EP155]KAF3767210.1 hypothetical protein M406DRAFT_69373 [Cryphonectria parasitica EP155]
MSRTPISDYGLTARGRLVSARTTAGLSLNNLGVLAKTLYEGSPATARGTPHTHAGCIVNEDEEDDVDHQTSVWPRTGRMSAGKSVVQSDILYGQCLSAKPRMR